MFYVGVNHGNVTVTSPSPALISHTCAVCLYSSTIRWRRRIRQVIKSKNAALHNLPVRDKFYTSVVVIRKQHLNDVVLSERSLIHTQLTGKVVYYITGFFAHLTLSSGFRGLARGHPAP